VYVGDAAPVVREILGFLGADGLTNRQIAGRLGIEERSAEGHVDRIRQRLGVRSRAQIATWWASAHGS
jgi:DNA-binding CsgD family transcriptional regulator